MSTLKAAGMNEELKLI